MQAIINELKRNELLTSSHIVKLHDMINKNYPTSSKQECAVIFAKNIHQIIDHTLLPFDKTHQITIKQHLLPLVVNKENFSISAYDIFETCVFLHFTEESTLPHLTNWINTYQNKLLTKEQVCHLSTLVQLPTLSSPKNEKEVPSSTPIHTDLPMASPSIYHQLVDFLRPKWIYLVLSIAAVSVVLSLTYKTYFIPNTTDTFNASFNTDSATFPICITLTQKANHLQPHLQYKKIDCVALQLWLNNRNSLLAQEPYFSEIISTSKDYNINPLLLFAITGQEQGFVPKDHARALEIAQNPFNVYGSWKNYNTTLKDSTRIASKTIINLSKDCPDYVDPIHWLNREYAEDPNWHKGVSALLKELEEVTALP